jgi:alkanesulfonate monooxygenase SsuD/methylene tetrahydromethanopterin reductase-like flavin-dependent oxidoreductase (luciferase family)
MRFSLFYNGDMLPGKPLAELYQDIEQQAMLGDALNFDAIWLAEHHFDFYGRIPNPLQFLARLSGLTRTIRLGTAVVEAPHYHPLRLAEDSALLDVLSSGRLRLGIGSGARNKAEEFALLGTPIEQKNTRTQEMVEILHRAFDDDSVDFEGVHYSYKNVRIVPRPVQPARKLIWQAASNTTVQLAGRAGYALLLPRVGPASRHRQLIEEYQAALDGKEGFIASLRFVYLAETEREAQQEARQTIARYARYDLGIDWDGHIGTGEYRELLTRLNAVVGTPEQVIHQLRAWQQETPFDEIMCQVYAAGMTHEHALRALTLLAHEVFPVLLSASQASQ